jgi:hypothetical protein
MDTAGTPPDWFTSDALAQDAMAYIHSGEHSITFTSDAQRDPQRQKCNYGPFLEEPGNLNFIIIATVNPTMAAPHQQPITVGSIFHIIYRPDNRGSSSGFLHTPFLINLSANNAHKGYDTFFKNNWTIGSGPEIQFDKPLGGQ